MTSSIQPSTQAQPSIKWKDVVHCHYSIINCGYTDRLDPNGEYANSNNASFNKKWKTKLENFYGELEVERGLKCVMICPNFYNSDYTKRYGKKIWYPFSSYDYENNQPIDNPEKPTELDLAFEKEIFDKLITEYDVCLDCIVFKSIQSRDFPSEIINTISIPNFMRDNIHHCNFSEEISVIKRTTFKYNNKKYIVNYYDIDSESG